jgi:urease accessory protein
MQMILKQFLALSITLILGLLATSTVLAHEQAGVAGGFISGFTHPILGPDHMVAMIAVGLWGAQLGNPAIWVLPITFPMVMAFGGLLGIMGVPVPFVEIDIALSAIVLGAMVALYVKPALWVAALLVGAFAIFHGHAHGAELPQAANVLAYSVGFVVATGLLHLLGIVIGLLISWPLGERVIRACGVFIAVLGGFFLISQLVSVA